MSSTKWLRKLAEGRFSFLRRKPKTPIPPKPYVDTANVSKHMNDPRYYDPNDLRNVDPEKPHWDDPRFETKETKPFFDLFGINRDWSMSLFKLSSIFLVVFLYQEFRLAAFARAEGIDARVSQAPNTSPLPDYARDDKATEEELRAAGFAFVGVKKLDSLGSLAPKTVADKEVLPIAKKP